jgi:hypothetical protein
VAIYRCAGVTMPEGEEPIAKICRRGLMLDVLCASRPGLIALSGAWLDLSVHYHLLDLITAGLGS